MTKQKTYKIKPINTVEEVKKDYDWVYDWIDTETTPLENLTEEKEVTVFRFEGYKTTEEIVAEMASQGLKPIAPNYLLGLMKHYPDALKSGDWCVSTASVFADRDGRRCFLFVRRESGRELYFVNLYRWWLASNGWCFLAERTSELKPSETLGKYGTWPLPDELIISGIKYRKVK